MQRLAARRRGRRFRPRGGVLGAILKERRPFVLEGAAAVAAALLRRPGEVGAFVGVPVVEGRTARGILVADRARRAQVRRRRGRCCWRSAAAQVVRVVQSERVFQAVERSKHEHERFYRASAGAEPRADPRRGLRRRRSPARAASATSTSRPSPPTTARAAATPSGGSWARARTTCSAPATRIRRRSRRWW